MSNKTQLDSIKSELQILSTAELSSIKGGLLIYCEEKRSTFLGINYTSRQWKAASNGSLRITVRM